MIRYLTLFLAISLAACSSNAPSVRVVGDLVGMQALSGEWAGEYIGTSSGRSGSISFRLDAGRDSAFGDVVMIPQGSSEPLRAADRAAGQMNARQPLVLAIRFVRVAGTTLSGRLEPYTIPGCSCTLNTTFTGEMKGDVIEGTYTTNGEPTAGVPQTGHWKVTRRH